MKRAASTCRHHDLRTVWRDWSGDLDRHLLATSSYSVPRQRWRGRLSVAFTPSLLALLVHRLAHAATAMGFLSVGQFLASANRRMWRLDLAPRSCLGAGVFLPHPVGVCFDADAGPELTVYSQVVCGPVDDRGRPRLGRGVTLGVHSVVTGPVAVGDGATIGFRSVLKTDLALGATLLSGRRPKVRRAELVNPLEEGSQT